ncbi:MAG TPA: hypothetical protein VF181_10425 [Balneolaceae bacterium]
MKKLVCTILTLLFLVSFSTAQKRFVEKSFSMDNDDKVRLDLPFGDMISIKSWNKDEVLFKAEIEINGGKLNEALIFDFSHENGRLDIESDYDEDMLKTGRREDCPDEYSRYSWSDDDSYYMVCSNIKYQVLVPRNADIGVETISGDIELVHLSGPIHAKSISGFVDLSWPSGESADIRIKTISGEAYTNLENLHFKNKKEHIPLVGYELKGQIGSGGSLIVLESISGDIYLREK